MTGDTMMASFLISANVMISLHPTENTTVNLIFYLASLVLFVVAFCKAHRKEQKLKDRIKTLEDEVNKNSSNIHSIVKKQSDRTIEYYVD